MAKKPTRTRKPPRRVAHISLGPGNRLYSEDSYLVELAPLGVTRRGFRSLLRALGVPTIELGRTRFVDNLSLAMALRAVLAIGKPDFLTPGCETLRRSRGGPSTLDPEEVVSNYTRFVGELLVSDRLSRGSTPRQIRRAARRVALRLRAIGLQSLAGTSRDVAAMRAYASLIERPLEDLSGEGPLDERESEDPTAE